MPETIQHIQHIQHFSRKKHNFQKSSPNIFNIFKLSAERSIFCSKRGSFCRKIQHVKKKPLFQQKKFNIDKKNVLSAEIIQHTPTKGLPQGKC